MPACFMFTRVRTPSSQVRERERERECERERERERVFILKGMIMMGALAPFSYLVL